MTAAQLSVGLIQYVALLLALCVHEFAHAASAYWLGDDTAARQGRLTLSPLAHVDPIGTVLVPIAGFLLGSFTSFGFLFGWAKPVPFQASNFRRGWFGRGHVLVAGAGPASNVLQGFFWLIVLAVLTRIGIDWRDSYMLELGLRFVIFSIVINFVLALFNMLPIPPLDGGAVASWGLPRHLGNRFDEIVGPYGTFILLGLLVTGLLGVLLQPAHWAADFLMSLVTP
ncbi:MAG: site-2 protease family protein [Acidobacteriota bacterium]